MSKRPNGKTVTLCMIVKDEEHIIHECLDSMAPYIDRYDITDTGSTDRTKEIIREWGEKNNIPGTVYDAPWQGFGKSRTVSLRNADKGGADYSWVIDADDKVSGDFVYPPEFGNHAGYTLKINRGDFEWWRNQIFKNNMEWEYVGVLHEYANSPNLEKEAAEGRGVARLLGNYFIDARTMGNRTKQFDPQLDTGEPETPGQEQWRKKYLADAATILDCLTNPDNENYEPDNLRYYFYLAQSYFDGADWKSAKEWYEKRAEKGGWEEEQWYSVLRCAMCMTNMGEPWASAQDVFLQAWNLRPTRSEPLYNLARIHRLNGNPRLGYMFAKLGCQIPLPPQDVLFVSKDVYEWQMFDELASTAWYANDMHAGLAASNKLLSEKKYPESEHERILNNWKQYVAWHEEQEKNQKQAEEQATKDQILRQEAERQESLQRKEQTKLREQQKKINKRRKKQKAASKSRKASRR
jgi:glycosyltransferase involved in cell wall biosynthesis